MPIGLSKVHGIFIDIDHLLSFTSDPNRTRQIDRDQAEVGPPIQVPSECPPFYYYVSFDTESFPILPVESQDLEDHPASPVPSSRSPSNLGNHQTIFDGDPGTSQLPRDTDCSQEAPEATELVTPSSGTLESPQERPEALDTSRVLPSIMGNFGHGLGPVPGMPTTPVDPEPYLDVIDAQENLRASPDTPRYLPDYPWSPD